jgi:multicomponent Na+:H+ antiporter subunit F
MTWLSLEGQSPLITLVYTVLIVALALCFLRLARGPSLADRIVALDIIGTTAAGVIAVTVVSTGQGALIEVALAAAMVSFLGVVAFARYLERRGHDE